MSTPLPTILYRYRNMNSVVSLETFRAIRHTPRGCWIRVEGREKFILNTSRKRYAYPTTELAKESFLARKRRQLGILRAQIKDVERAVLAMEEGRLNDYRHLQFEHYEDY